MTTLCDAIVQKTEASDTCDVTRTRANDAEEEDVSRNDDEDEVSGGVN